MSGAGRVPRLPHMPGLDGLRAVAVGAVLLYHADVEWMPGGFIGVDVFFVLSGYLITSLLLEERGREGRIALKRFYLRRARRLLPAAILVIAVSLLITAIFLPGDLGDARGDAVASLLYVNNWYQIVADRSYFEAFGTPSLFQHIWSLAVEEQFYLLWPLALGAGLTFLKRERTVIATAGVALASVILMAVLFDAGSDPTRVYYGTDTRVFVLLIGALLAFAWPPTRLTDRVQPQAVKVLDATAAAGTVLLVLAFLGLKEYQAFLYRGGFLLVALVTAILIAATVHPASHARNILGHRSLTWIGERSYGIYLWHWPVMALSRPELDVQLTRWVLVPLQLALTVALAAASYSYLELPFRRGTAIPWIRARLDRLPPRRRLAAVAGAALALIIPAAFSFARPVPKTPQPRTLSTEAARSGAVAPVQTRADGTDPPLAIGSSVMLGAARELQRRLGPDAVIDAAVARQAAEVVALLEGYKEQGALPDRVIVQIGENGPIEDETLVRLRRVLAGTPTVILVNVRVPLPWEEENDAKLRELDASWPEARLADWRAASGGGPDVLFDGVHPTVEGRKLYVRTVLEALRG